MAEVPTSMILKSCAALQILLVDLLHHFNVHPSAAIGHSSGELATAYAFGRATAAEAMAAPYICAKVAA